MVEALRNKFLRKKQKKEKAQAKKAALLKKFKA